MCPPVSNLDTTMLYRGSIDIYVSEKIPDDKVDGKKAKGSTFAVPSVYEYCTVFAFGFLYEVDYSLDDILVDDVLYVIFRPIEGEETHAFDDGIVLRVSSRAVNYVCDLVKGEPFDILDGVISTWAMI